MSKYTEKSETILSLCIICELKKKTKICKIAKFHTCKNIVT